MKTIKLIMIPLLLMGCKSKKVVKDVEVQKETVKISVLKDSTQNNTKIQEKEVISKKESTEQKKDVQTEITIKGKTETNKPLELHEIKNGDTLQSIRIVGNADVFIRSKNSNSNNFTSEKESKTLTEALKDFSQNIVEENNVKERVAEMKKRTQEVNTKTGTFWSFGLIAIFGVVALLIIGIIIYLKK